MALPVIGYSKIAIYWADSWSYVSGVDAYDSEGNVTSIKSNFPSSGSNTWSDYVTIPNGTETVKITGNATNTFYFSLKVV